MTARPDARLEGRLRRADRVVGAEVAVKRVRALGGIDLVRARFVNHPTRAHAHSDYEIGVVVSGVRLVSCRGRTVPAARGSILVFNPGEVHAGAPLDGTSSTYRSFLVSTGALRSVPSWAALLASSGPWFPTPVIKDPALSRRLTGAHQTLEDAGDGPNVEARLIEALDDLARHHGERLPAGGSATNEHLATRLVRAYLEEHYAKRIRLETLSTISGLGVFHLIRVFRLATGLPPYAYLEQIRVARAAALLREGRPVSQIAARTGFSDQSHLTRFFKRIVGVPPGQYRRSVLEADARGRAARRDPP